jgi:putative transposase
MPDYRRYYIPNALVFITCVTRDRLPYLRDKRDVQLLLETMRRVQAIHPFRLLAYVILPDHFHWLMLMDAVCDTFSTVMHSVKRNYTLNYKHVHELGSTVNLWQDRFWDHVVRNEQDFKNHFDYIHWNPVKHGYVTHPEDWIYSTYRHWLERGYYEAGWGDADEPANISDMNPE